jgi:hypothetical protein
MSASNVVVLGKVSMGGAVGVVLSQFSKRFRPVAENGNKERHLRSPLEASSLHSFKKMSSL